MNTQIQSRPLSGGSGRGTQVVGSPSRSGTTKFVCCVGYSITSGGCHVCSSEVGVEVQTISTTRRTLHSYSRTPAAETVACKDTRQTDRQEIITTGLRLCCGGGGDR